MKYLAFVLIVISSRQKEEALVNSVVENPTMTGTWVYPGSTIQLYVTQNNANLTGTGASGINPITGLSGICNYPKVDFSYTVNQSSSNPTYTFNGSFTHKDTVKGTLSVGVGSPVNWVWARTN